jgi:hypothetical protein
VPPPVQLIKERKLLRLIARLRTTRPEWFVDDQWDADLCATGVVNPARRRRLVYVSTFGLPAGRYYYSLETGSLERDTPEGKNVSFKTLLAAMDRHLGHMTGPRRPS